MWYRIRSRDYLPNSRDFFNIYSVLFQDCFLQKPRNQLKTFQIHFRQTKACKKYKSTVTTEKEKPEKYLILPANRKTFKQALDHKIYSETDHKYHFCGHERQALNKIITKPPKAIMVCLSIFDMKGEKIKDAFQIPQTLDLSPYLKDGEDSIYDLKSTVIHRGTPMHATHYVSARNICQNKKRNV